MSECHSCKLPLEESNKFCPNCGISIREHSTTYFWNEEKIERDYICTVLNHKTCVGKDTHPDKAFEKMKKQLIQKHGDIQFNLVKRIVNKVAKKPIIERIG